MLTVFYIMLSPYLTIFDDLKLVGFPELWVTLIDISFMQYTCRHSVVLESNYIVNISSQM